MNIPDFAGGQPGKVQDVMQTGGGPLQNVRVKLWISHSEQGDISVQIRHDASGAVLTLMDRPGFPDAGPRGFTAAYIGTSQSDGRFVLDDSADTTYDSPHVAPPGISNVRGFWRPDDPLHSLADFNGLTANTTWTLTVADNNSSFTGTLRFWEICTDSLLGEINPIAAGEAFPVNVQLGASSLLRAHVTPAAFPPSTGITVTANLGALGGGTAQPLFDDGTNGDEVSGDNIFSLTVAAGQNVGLHAIPLSISDAEGRQSTGTISLRVLAGNDSCVDAIPLQVGVPTRGDTGAMTDDLLPACPTAWLTRAVWFRITGTGNIFSATTCGTVGTLPAHTVSVFSGSSCGDLTCVGSSTTAFPACAQANAATIDFCSIPGETYYIAVSRGGPFSITVDEGGPCPVNDTCTSATFIPVGSSINTSNLGLTNDTPCGSTVINSGAWFWTIGNGRVLNFTTCGAGTGVDTNLRILRGDCASMTCLGTNPTPVPGCVPSNAQAIRLCTEPDVPYFIVVGSDASPPVQGSFQLSVIDESPCPSNDTCETATPVSIGESVIGTNVGAGSDAVPYCFGQSSLTRAVWFRFAGNGNRLRVSTCGTTTLTDTRLQVYVGTCNSLVCVSGNNDTSPACSPSIASTVEFCSDPELMYYAVVGATAMAAFDFSVTDIGPTDCFIGGCCLGDSCSAQVPEDCAALGGTFLGYGSSCTPLGVQRTYTSHATVYLNNCIQTSMHIDDDYIIGELDVVVNHSCCLDHGTSTIRLRGPDGLLRLLYGGSCSGHYGSMNVRFHATGEPIHCSGQIIGQYRSASLSSYAGQNINGTWTLDFCEGTPMQVAAITSWSLIVRERDPNGCSALCTADWCRDGSVSVVDIFCFLSDWFAGEPAAREFGGTPGVPALFAFIGHWLSNGNGPCSP